MATPRKANQERAAKPAPLVGRETGEMLFRAAGSQEESRGADGAAAAAVYVTLSIRYKDDLGPRRKHCHSRRIFVTDANITRA